MDKHLLRCVGKGTTTGGAEGCGDYLLQLAGSAGVSGRLAGAHRYSAGVWVRADAHVGGGGGDIWTLLYLDVHDSEPECFEEWSDEGYGLLSQAFRVGGILQFEPANHMPRTLQISVMVGGLWV
jgi:hypothetical protein